MRIMMKSKIHRATVTQADLDYVGSVTIDADLLDAADLLEGEQVAIVDITNGARIETYVIPAERGSGVIGINGAAARLMPLAMPNATSPLNTGPPLSPGMHSAPLTVIHVGSHGPPHRLSGGA